VRAPRILSQDDPDEQGEREEEPDHCADDLSGKSPADSTESQALWTFDRAPFDGHLHICHYGIHRRRVERPKIGVLFLDPSGVFAPVASKHLAYPLVEWFG